MHQFCLIIIIARDSECDELELGCAKLVTNRSETWCIYKMAGVERCEYNQRKVIGRLTNQYLKGGFTLNTVKKLSGVALAAAAATLFVAGCATQDTVYEATGKVECTGVNGCKGLSDCKTASNVCKGKNSCAGQGFVFMTPLECWRYQLWKKSFP